MYPFGLDTTTTSLGVGVSVALLHYAIRRNWVELFGTGFGLLIVGSTMQVLGCCAIALMGLWLGDFGISYIVVSAIIALFLAIQHGMKVFMYRVLIDAAGGPKNSTDKDVYSTTYYGY
jgi:hypothetical protein